jgi:hypothetical protein
MLRRQSEAATALSLEPNAYEPSRPWLAAEVAGAFGTLPMNRSAGLGPALGFRPADRVNCFINFAHRCFATR